MRAAFAMPGAAAVVLPVDAAAGTGGQFACNSPPGGLWRDSNGTGSGEDRVVAVLTADDIVLY